MAAHVTLLLKVPIGPLQVSKQHWTIFNSKAWPFFPSLWPHHPPSPFLPSSWLFLTPSYRLQPLGHLPLLFSAMFLWKTASRHSRVSSKDASSKRLVYCNTPPQLVYYNTHPTQLPVFRFPVVHFPAATLLSFAGLLSTEHPFCGRDSINRSWMNTWVNKYMY